MVIEQRPGERQKTHERQRRTVIRALSPVLIRTKRTKHWQRRQELLRRDRAMAGVFGFISLVGTLAMLYIAAQASATDEGYRRSDLRRQIKLLDAQNLNLQGDIRRREDANAIAQEAIKRNLVRTAEGIHYFGERH